MDKVNLTLALKPKLIWLDANSCRVDGEGYAGVRLDSCSYKEVFVEFCRHFEKPMRSQGELIAATYLLPVLVPGFNGGLAGAVAVEASENVEFLSFPGSHFTDLNNYLLIVG